jgi:hypothetical protein
MAFTSETILKFGSTTINFAVITLLDYSLENEKAGAFAYRRKETVSLQGLFSNRESNVPIKEHFRQIQLLLENATDFVDLQLNDKSYGKARFLSFAFPASVAFDENSVRFSKINIQLEILKDDSSGTFANNNLPSSVSSLSSNWYKLKNFNENLSFALTEDGNFSATHTISFGYDNIDKSSDSVVVTEARDIANKFFAQSLDALSSIRSFYSSTDFQISASDYGSSLVDQTIDLINYTFSYSKNYIVFSNNSSTTTETIVTEINYAENGVIEVIEKARIKGKGNNYSSARANAISKLESNLSSSYSRCNDAFNRYFTTNYSKFAQLLPKFNSSDSLQSNPVSISKDLSEFGPEIGYEIRFTTSPVYALSTRIHSYSVSLNRTPEGIYDAQVSGSIKYYTNKNKSFPLSTSGFIADIKSIIDNDTTLGKDLITPYYAKLAGSGTYTGIKINSSLSHTKFGVETTYTKNYSNSGIYLASGGLVRQVSITENIALPTNRFSTVNIPGSYNLRSNTSAPLKTLGKEVIYQTRQLGEGAKSISLDIKVDRNILYAGSSPGVNTNVDSVFAKIYYLLTSAMINKNTSGYLVSGANPLLLSTFTKIFNEGFSFKIGDLTYFLDNLTLSANNNYNIKVNFSYKFFAKKEVL